MGRIILLTLLADIGSCITMLIYFTVLDSFGMGLYAGVLTFGNILIPSIGAVLLFKLIKRWISLSNSTLLIMIQVTLLTVLLIFGLFVWAAIDSILFETMTWQNIKYDYDSQFSGFLPVVLAEAVLIPIIDLWLTKRNNKKSLRGSKS
jgi:flagellar biosynthesis protein FlhB